jgi:hypothetical protein
VQRTLDRQEDEIEHAAADFKNFSDAEDERMYPTLGLADAEAVMTPPAAATDPSGAA